MSDGIFQKVNASEQSQKHLAEKIVVEVVDSGGGFRQDSQYSLTLMSFLIYITKNCQLPGSFRLKIM